MGEVEGVGDSHKRRLNRIYSCSRRKDREDSSPNRGPWGRGKDTTSL